MKDKYCIINLKAQEVAFNENLDTFIEKVEKCSDLAQELGVHLVLCINSYDLKDAVLKSRNVEIYAQHCDPVDFGSHTGSIPTSVIVRLGAIGTLISHSEKYLSVEDSFERFKAAKEMYIETCVCARDVDRVIELQDVGIKGLIAIEPPELIGGDISVSTANPQIISSAVEVLQEGTILLAGAGVKNRDDVKKAIELGTHGILVSSGVVKAKDVEAEVKDLLEGFREE